MADRNDDRPSVLDEFAAIRWLLLSGFVICTLGLVFTLWDAVAPWAGLLAGASIFGIFAAPVLLREMQIREGREARADHLRNRRGFDVGDDNPPPTAQLPSGESAPWSGR